MLLLLLLNENLSIVECVYIFIYRKWADVILDDCVCVPLCCRLVA